MLITPKIRKKIVKRQLSWDNLLVDHEVDESIIEYIDPDEQNYSLIAMNNKDFHNEKKKHYRYTHSEIHPSTIFGILASCIPFPEHNQSLEIHINVLWVNKQWELM